MSETVPLFRDISDHSLRRTIMSCVWLAAIAKQSSGGSDVSDWLEHLAGHCLDERKRRNRAKRYHVRQVDGVRVYSDLVPGVLRRKHSTGEGHVRDALTAALFGSAPGGAT